MEHLKKFFILYIPYLITALCGLCVSANFVGASGKHRMKGMLPGFSGAVGECLVCMCPPALPRLQKNVVYPLMFTGPSQEAGECCSSPYSSASVTQHKIPQLSEIIQYLSFCI